MASERWWRRVHVVWVAAIGLAASLVVRPGAAEVYVYRGVDGQTHFTNAAPRDGRGYRLYRGVDDAPRGARSSARDGARFTRYDAWIVEASKLYQVPEALVRAIIRCESDYDPRAVSAAGARGLMQLMPVTAKRLGVRDVLDPRDNIFGGVRLLRELANEFHGDLILTVAAYNAGDSAVVKFGGVPPFAQTREYVAAVTMHYQRYLAVAAGRSEAGASDP